MPQEILSEKNAHFEKPDNAETLEQNADDFVSKNREKGGVSRRLYEETGINKALRETLGEDMAGIIEDEPTLSPAEKRVILQLSKKEDELSVEIEKLLGDDAELGRFADFRQENLKKALREDKKITVAEQAERAVLSKILGREQSLSADEYDKRLSEMATEESAVEKAKRLLVLSQKNKAENADAKTGASLSAEETRILNETRANIARWEEKRKEVLQSSPEAFIGLHLKELKQYRKDIDDGGIAETPYVKGVMDEIVAHAEANIPVMLLGHYGSGKTEVAIQTAKKYLSGPALAHYVSEHPEPTEENFENDKEGYKKAKESWNLGAEKAKEPIVFRCAKDMVLEELYGHLALVSGETKSFDEFYKELESEKEKFMSEHSDIPEADKKYYDDLITEYAFNREKRGTKTDFLLGPVYRSIKEDKPLILDEINAMPHSLNISLNNIITRKPGDTVSVQQDGVAPIRVGKGFSVLATGNVGAKYKREKIDIAFLSRFHPIEYEYLPQYYPKTASDTESLEQNAGDENELYHVLLGMTMDAKGNLAGSEGSLQKLWQFAYSSKILQDVFSGKSVDVDKYGYAQGSGAKTLYHLQEFVPSIRQMARVIEMWQSERKYDFDHYLWNEMIRPIQNPADRVYTFQVYEEAGFFSGWNHGSYMALGGAGQFVPIDPKKPYGETEFVPPKTVVESAFGKVPERKEWMAPVAPVPEGERAWTVEEMEKRLKELFGRVKEIRDESNEKIRLYEMWKKANKNLTKDDAQKLDAAISAYRQQLSVCDKVKEILSPFGEDISAVNLSEMQTALMEAEKMLG